MDSARRSREIVLLALLSALQAIATLLPVSKFIGGGGFITFDIVMVPVIAFLLEPWQAFLSGLIGALLGFFLDAPFGLGLAPVGPTSLIVSPLAAYLGSITFHYDKRWFKWSSVAWLALPLGYIGFGAVFYAVFSQGTLLWLVPYVIAIFGLLYRPIAKRINVQVLIGCLAAAICWQVGLNIISIGVLGLVGSVWLAITPFMYFERLVATLGSFVIIEAILKINHPLVRRMLQGHPRS